MGEREREREKEWERERERERRREYLAGSYYYNEMRIALHTCLPDNFLVCWPPVTALSVFHGNLPQEIWGTYFPHRESTSWNFPAKIRKSLRPIPSFDMMSKFPGSDHFCRRRYVAKLLAERKKNNNNNNERDICQLAYAKLFAKTTGTNSPDGHATIQPKWRNIKKSRWTVRQQWLVVTRPSADCRTTFFRRFKQFGIFLKKVAERSRDSGRKSRDHRMTVKQRF